MKNILFLNDYSDHAKQAYQFALRLSQHFEANIHMVHIFKPSSSASALMSNQLGENDEMIENMNRWDDFQVEEETEKLKTFALQHTPKQSHDLLGELYIQTGNPASEIIEVIKTEKIDLLVLGMNQQNKLANALFGNLSLQLIDKAPCHLFLIPKDANYMGINNIVFAADFNNYTLKSIDYLIGWAKAFKAQLDILHIASNRFDSLDSKKKLEEWEKHFEKEIDKNKIAFHLMDGEIEETIEMYTEMVKADIVCLSTPTRDFWSTILKPNITKNIARKIKTPVLVLKPSN